MVKEGYCILGNVTEQELGVLHIGPRVGPGGDKCNEIKSDFAESLKAQYPKVFIGIGKLKLKLHVWPNVPPWAQKVRGIPFALCEKVEAMIEELLEADIIERVDGLTTWAGAVTIALKLNSNIRLHVDIRQENEAIVREWWAI